MVADDITERATPLPSSRLYTCLLGAYHTTYTLPHLTTAERDIVSLVWPCLEHMDASASRSALAHTCAAHARACACYHHSKRALPALPASMPAHALALSLSPLHACALLRTPHCSPAKGRTFDTRLLTSHTVLHSAALRIALSGPLSREGRIPTPSPLLLLPLTATSCCRAEHSTPPTASLPACHPPLPGTS